MSPDPADLRLSSYAFDLPESFIAQRPVEPRHAARLLAVEPLSAVGHAHAIGFSNQPASTAAVGSEQATTPCVDAVPLSCAVTASSGESDDALIDARLDATGSGAAPCRHLSVWDLQAELRPGDLLVVNNTRVLKARLQARRASGGAVELLVLEPAGLATPLPPEVTAGPSDWLCLARPAKRLQPGEVLFSQGQPGGCLWVLGRGCEVSLTAQSDPSRPPVHLATLTEGQTLGGDVAH